MRPPLIRRGVIAACHTRTMAAPPRHLSPSSASAFVGCPKRWKFKYIDGLPEPSNEAAVVGTFAHLVLEHLFALDPALRTINQAKALARQFWPDIEAMDDYVALELNDEDARDFRWKAWEAIEGLWTLEDPGQIQVEHTERRVAATLDGVPFFGVVDRIERDAEGRIIIADYKSGKAPNPRFADDKHQQVLLYAAAVAELEGELPARSRLLYLGQRTIDLEVTSERLGDATAALSTTWQEIGHACATETFDPKPSVLCGWCPFLTRCDAGMADVQGRIKRGKLPAHAPAHQLLRVA